MRGQSRCRAAGDRGLEEKRKTAAPEAGRLGGWVEGGFRQAGA